jgi:pimeloyl-ACP methyl ester carboxylesterase
MRRFLIVLGALLGTVIVVPPLLGSLLGWNDFSASLPEPGERVELRSGGHINVIDSGDGSPVVLVHGLPGSGYDWKPLPQKLEDLGCRVIRFDRVGYGHSSRRRSGEEHSLEANARDLVALLDALGIDRVTPVGWSYGGGVVQVSAVSSPERVNALALVGSIGPAFRPSEPTLVERVLFSRPLVWWGFAVGLPARANTAQISAAAFSPDEVSPWWVDQSVALMALPGAFGTLRAEDARMASRILRPAEIEAQTLVFQGAEDAFVPLHVGEDLHQRIRRSELIVVPRGSHMLPVTHADLLGERIAAIAGCSKASIGEGSALPDSGTHRPDSDR